MAKTITILRAVQELEMDVDIEVKDTVTNVERDNMVDEDGTS